MELFNFQRETRLLFTAPPDLDEASFSLKPLQALQLSAGIVYAQFNPISSTFSPSGFSGLRESYIFQKGNFETSFNADQISPNSVKMADRAVDQEKNPFLNILNTNLVYNDDKFKIGFGYSRYDFYGMTSASAQDSRYLGNTVVGQGLDIVTYKYKFRGQEVAAMAEVTTRLDDKLGVSGHITKNDEAIRNRDTAWLTNIFYQYNFDQFSLVPSVSRFRFESDVMPAFFSSGNYGYLNRDGYYGEIRGLFNKYNVEAYVRYLDAKEAEFKAVQSDRIAVSLGMEVKYEIF
jgi:hypothetical protein